MKSLAVKAGLVGALALTAVGCGGNNLTTRDDFSAENLPNSPGLENNSMIQIREGMKHLEIYDADGSVIMECDVAKSMKLRTDYGIRKGSFDKDSGLLRLDVYRK